MKTASRGLTRRRAELADGPRWGAYLACACIFCILFFAVAVPTWRATSGLGEPNQISGYSLLGVFAFLILFNLRKRLAVVPLIHAHWWTVGHIGAGFLALAVFFLHTNGLWPLGHYEQWLAGAFYFVTLTGIVGTVLQYFIPRHLTKAGDEFIFERIPEQVSLLKREAEQVILTCTRESGHDTVARFYVESLADFFARPRLRIGQFRAPRITRAWLTRRFATVGQYVDSTERVFLDKLETLALRKLALDAHYFGQSLLKGWLLAHVPAVVSLVVLALWHTLLVHVYAL